MGIKKTEKLSSTEDIIKGIKNELSVTQKSTMKEDGEPTKEKNTRAENHKVLLIEVLTKENWRDHAEDARIQPGKSYPEPESAFDRIEPDNSKISMAAKGSIVVMSGKAKGGKTKCTQIIATALLQRGNYENLIYSNDTEGSGKVMIIDTEQTKPDVRKSYDIIFKLLADKKKIENLFLFSLRKYNHKERLQLVINLLQNESDMEILIIDGIRDLLGDINSVEESMNLVSLLLKWSSDYGVTIVVVIHENKINSELRGHTGTELQNKADTVINVAKSGDAFIAKCILARGKKFSPFAFRLDSDGVPIIDLDIDLSKLEAAGTGNATAVVTNDLHREALSKAYDGIGVTLPGWRDLVNKLIVFFKSKSLPAGENKMREYINHYQDMGWIKKEPVEGRGYGGYRLLQ